MRIRAVKSAALPGESGVCLVFEGYLSLVEGLAHLCLSVSISGYKHEGLKCLRVSVTGTKVKGINLTLRISY